jgi:2-polyprenyl-3-methyl-5-hydroxy-6-metoxy-1,4-benzoquinol methylase
MNNYDYSIYYRRFHDDSQMHAETMARMMGNLLQAHLPKERSAPIIDVGCGFGFALRAMRNFGYTNLLGLEMSPEQAKMSRNAGFNVVVTDDTIAWLDTNREQFAFAALLDVLEHVPIHRQIEFTRAIHQALQPGGKLFLTVPNANSILSPRWRYNDYTHHSSFTEHSLYFVLKNAGFDQIKIDPSKGLAQFPWRLWRRHARHSLRRWIVRWCWLQVFKAEIPWEKLDDISFELNLHAVAS